MDGDKSTKFIEIAIGLLIFCLLAAAVIFLVNKGRTFFAKGSDNLTETMDNLDFSAYDIYSNTKQKGNDVIRVINDVLANEQLTVLVSTKDGKNYVYSAQPFDMELDKQLTGKPALATGSAIETAPSTLFGSTGYVASVSVDTPGFISSSTTFYCTIQKDLNGNLRRITFVQQ